MKLLTTLRRMFARDTNDVPPFDPRRIHDLFDGLQKARFESVSNDTD